MKIIEKTLKKIKIEIFMADIKKNGFDFMWDKIRYEYPVYDYEINSIKNTIDESMIITFNINNSHLFNNTNFSYSSSTKNY
jgi:hypothetical protein